MAPRRCSIPTALAGLVVTIGTTSACTRGRCVLCAAVVTGRVPDCTRFSRRRIFRYAVPRYCVSGHSTGYPICATKRCCMRAPYPSRGVSGSTMLEPPESRQKQVSPLTTFILHCWQHLAEWGSRWEQPLSLRKPSRQALVKPFPGIEGERLSYYAICPRANMQRPEVEVFLTWLKAQWRTNPSHRAL